MLKGSFPDPEKLVPAVHIENLSLSWLLTGDGSPHLVQAMASDEAAAAFIKATMESERACEILVIASSLGFTPVLHQLTSGVPMKGVPYVYQKTFILVGPLARLTQSAVGQSAGLDTDRARYSRVRSIRIPEHAHRLVMQGYMGTAKLFGEDCASGIFGDAQPETRPDALSDYVTAERLSLGQVSESSRNWITGTQRQLNQLFDMLGAEDQEFALRLVHGLTLTRE